MLNKLFYIFLLLCIYKGIIFTLNEDISTMCFLIEGKILNKKLRLNYFISGENAYNVRMSILDITASIMLKKFEGKENDKINNKRYISIPINQKHLYRVCWESKDGSEKEVNFVYKHKLQVRPVLKKDISKHITLLGKFKNTLEEIKNLIDNHYIVEQEYHNTVGKLNDKIKNSFIIKGVVFFVIAIIQFLIFRRIINNKYNQVKKIIIGT